MGRCYRDQYELNVAMLDLRDQQISKEVAAGRMSGFESLRQTQYIEEERRKLKNRFFPRKK
jgi:hypothetical protein